MSVHDILVRSSPGCWVLDRRTALVVSSGFPVLHWCNYSELFLMLDRVLSTPELCVVCTSPDDHHLRSVAYCSSGRLQTNKTPQMMNLVSCQFWNPDKIVFTEFRVGIRGSVKLYASVAVIRHSLSDLTNWTAFRQHSWIGFRPHYALLKTSVIFHLALNFCAIPTHFLQRRATSQIQCTWEFLHWLWTWKLLLSSLKEWATHKEFWCIVGKKCFNVVGSLWSLPRQTSSMNRDFVRQVVAQFDLLRQM